MVLISLARGRPANTIRRSFRRHHHRIGQDLSWGSKGHGFHQGGNGYCSSMVFLDVYCTLRIFGTHQDAYYFTLESRPNPQKTLHLAESILTWKFSACLMDHDLQNCLVGVFVVKLSPRWRNLEVAKWLTRICASHLLADMVKTRNASR